jgi:Spy/CpxP family protein refolding chaperone
MITISRKAVMLSIIAFTCLSASVVAQDHKNGKGHQGRHGGHRSYSGKFKNHSLADKVNRVTQADSIQAKKMKPIIDKASTRLEVLRAEYQKKEKIVMDSLSLQLKPLLKDDQKKRLDELGGKRGSGRLR